jgi:hypothetical protein
MQPRAKPRKTWQEKLANDNGLPRVCAIDADKSKRELAAEGHKVVPKGKRHFVEKFAERVCAL